MDESRLPTLYDPAADTPVPFANTTFRVARAPLLAVAPHLAARIVPGFSLSPLFSPQPNETSSGSQPSPPTDSGSILKIDDLVSSHDFAALVAHLVYDTPATVAVLRASTSSALDIPSLRTTALAALADRFPSPLARLDEDEGKLDVDDDGGRGRAEDGEELEEALEIAMFSTNEVSPETKKTLLYRVATSTDFDPTGAHDPSLPTSTALSTSPPTAPDPTPILAAAHPALSPRTLRVCHRVLASLIAHFTPVLFTVGNAQHMACTDVLAARWMGDVIGPALADGGVGHPIETLARMRAAVSRSWVPLGVCAECERWLKAEYVGEGRIVWEKLDGWIEDAEKAEDAVEAGSLTASLV